MEKEQEISQRNKQIIARKIADMNCNSYEQNLNIIYDNHYRLIMKVPADTFLIGLLNTFKKEVNITLEEIKEVVVEALEKSGLEVTFTDKDWFDLKVLETGSQYYSEKYKLNTKKGYMMEFFE